MNNGSNDLIAGHASAISCSRHRAPFPVPRVDGSTTRRHLQSKQSCAPCLKAPSGLIHDNSGHRGVIAANAVWSWASGRTERIQKACLIGGGSAVVAGRGPGQPKRRCRDVTYETWNGRRLSNRVCGTPDSKYNLTTDSDGGQVTGQSWAGGGYDGYSAKARLRGFRCRLVIELDGFSKPQSLLKTHRRLGK